MRLREKIHKASAAKQRKLAKQAKKNPEWRSKLKKDPGIPNLFPYKEKILQEIEEKRRLKEEENAKRRELARAQKSGTAQAQDDLIEDSDHDTSAPLRTEGANQISPLAQRVHQERLRKRQSHRYVYLARSLWCKPARIASCTNTSECPADSNNGNEARYRLRIRWSRFWCLIGWTVYQIQQVRLLNHPLFFLPPFFKHISATPFSIYCENNIVVRSRSYSSRK